ncbi:Ldh family oxidoreductase [Candidatus Pelagibacter bacterium]|jgi:delta1-piperideine-2-carboxylate reductase|nr:Ldh family oxidoreductase [Candidatus Pelagibacter bacterium]MDA7443182.1 Ldh family oxidoreductase [Candidatus Pelagibacter ubique]MDC0569135.1 Ldh family oxidoreductase [bacterium]MDA7447808.1 Ldh family oxidoreductase [Candidatus Pelagibacter ubique]MDA7456265.1 Ldh family oxidoreductase [Candidatus Pelagibacter ubique]MDA7480987.1 Ldh family oxidoreductase [Candidatus Pelagibacter ubique]
MSTVPLTLSEILELAKKTLLANGCDEENASILADTIMRAERDGSVSHGLFRLPAYVAGLKSKKINGKARPELENVAPSIIKVLGNNAVAPMVLSLGLPAVIDLAKKNGVAVLAIKNSHHMAALWPETEAIAEAGLVGIACTSYKPAVAPAGATKPLYGTNPISFAWPRPGKTPVVYDMATASMAMGEVQIAKREGHKVPLGTGLTKEGKETIDPGEIADGGVILPFGGYKGSSIAMMVELLAGALIGENFSFETAAKDNNDGGPPSGGEFIIAISPDKISGKDWDKHADEFFSKMSAMDGVRLPGERRHKNRLNKGPRNINEELVNKIKSLS